MSDDLRGTTLQHRFTLEGLDHTRIEKPKGALRGLRSFRNGEFTLSVFLVGESHRMVCRVYRATNGDHAWYSVAERRV